ncbi:MAG: OmpA family protein [Chitinivibrionales bacterium]|nr:OmpA family protein [Chitinivibrionales bacterium]
MQTEFLPGKEKTIRLGIRGKLFGIYNGQEFDLSQEVEGFIDRKTGIARLEIKRLWFINDHYPQWQKDSQTPCKYKIKGIFHSLGENQVDSPDLEMPPQSIIDVAYIEIADIHFHHNCALPCLIGNGDLIDYLASALLYASKNTDRECILLGHADRTGNDAYNVRISKRRGEAILAILTNDSATWNTVVTAAGDHTIETEDYQQSLKALSDKYNWPCDPGAVDNKPGPKTEEGVRKFQDRYNTQFQKNTQLSVDGKFGPKSWEALLFVLRDLLDKRLESEEIETTSKITLGYPDGRGVYPCGERSPVISQEQSEKDRRVEICFYKKGEWKPVVNPETGGPCAENVDPVSGKNRTKAPIEPKIIPPQKQNDIKLALEYPSASLHKQYVNLASNGKELGQELTITVRAEGASDGDIVIWKVSADAANSKRNKPLPCLKDPAANKKSELKNNTAEIQSSISGGKASIILDCGVAGGDTFTVDITCGTSSVQCKAANWRRFWYQLTHQKGMKLPSFSLTENAWNEVYAEIIKGNTKEFEKDDLETLKTKNIRTLYKEYVINPGKSDNEVAVIGSHNRDYFYKLYTKDDAKSPKAHFIICQHQWDESSKKTKKMTVTCDKKVSAEVDLKKNVFFPYLKGEIIADGTWKALAPQGHTDHGKSGSLTDDWILLEKNRKSRQHIKFNVPDSAGLTPDKKAPIQITYRLKTVAGPYLGESNEHQILAVYNPKDPNDFNNTLTHEVGHSFNQVPKPGSVPSGLANHANQYTGCGGRGSHCNTVYDKNGKEKAGNLNKDGEYSTGVCVMFHAGDSSCINTFCSVCKPFVKANDFSSFDKV